MFISMQIKLIFMRKVLQENSFWNRNTKLLSAVSNGFCINHSVTKELYNNQYHHSKFRRFNLVLFVPHRQKQKLTKDSTD